MLVSHYSTAEFVKWRDNSHLRPCAAAIIHKDSHAARLMLLGRLPAWRPMESSMLRYLSAPPPVVPGEGSPFGPWFHRGLLKTVVLLLFAAVLSAVLSGKTEGAREEGDKDKATGEEKAVVH
ncbi:unnamed protein product [Pleuronectes platessa]|uniref:Uncharacterized protein n=1 Tax=Pleuronectes platessa TaxID=8262 RepID=A0A9N7U7K2_PLEPL|nr:unnamed protein product [Pleuronectes platessa]